MHFGTLFQRGKARIQTEAQTAICTRRTIGRFSGKLRQKGPADPNPPCASTRSRYLIIIIHKTRKNRGGNCLLCLNVATPLYWLSRPHLVPLKSVQHSLPCFNCYVNNINRHPQIIKLYLPCFSQYLMHPSRYVYETSLTPRL